MKIRLDIKIVEFEDSALDLEDARQMMQNQGQEFKWEPVATIYPAKRAEGGAIERKDGKIVYEEIQTIEIVCEQDAIKIIEELFPDSEIRFIV